MNRIIFFAASFFVAVTIQAQTLVEKVVPEEGSIDIAYEIWELDNGLTIIVHEDHSDPIVHVELTYHVGSNREQIGMTGFAHFFEHMMFQGSENVAEEEHFKIISESGGTMNGTTSNDRTNYFQTLPSNQLETALWLESDRMGFLLDEMTKEKFENQRDVVKNEKLQFQKNPYGLLMEVKNQTLYPNGHPYSWPIIGYIEDLDRATMQDLKDFCLRWYGPNNAYLVISGDVNTLNVIDLVNKYFGSIKRGEDVRKLRVPRVNLPQHKYKVFQDNIYFPWAMFTFPTVPSFHKDEPALDALADIMGDGNNSAIYQEFVKTEKAVQAYVSHPASELAGEFMINIMSYPNFTFAEVEQEVFKLLNDFESRITDEAIERFKVKMHSQIIEGLSSVQGKSSRLSRWAYLLDEPYNFQKSLDRYNNVKKEDVIKVYHKYIKNKKAAIIDYAPLPFGSKDSVKSVNPNAFVPFKKDKQYADLVYEKSYDNFDRSKRPTPTKPKPVQLPNFYQGNTNLVFETNNGIPYIGTKTSEVPKITILITLEGGDLLIQDDIKKVGLPELTSMMLEEGTVNFTTEEISLKLDELGSSISFNSSDNTSTIFVSSLVENIDETLKILEEKLYRPGFRIDDFKRVKKAFRESKNDDKKSGNYLGNTAFKEKLYGKSIQGVTETVKSIDKLKISDVQDFYDKQYNSNLASIVIVGNINEEEIIPKLSFLNDWQQREIIINKNIQRESIQGRNIYLVHKPGPQSVIMLGHHGPTYDVYGEFFNSTVMNYSFGGSFNSRLNLNLREDKGYTYGISSRFYGNENSGYFYISTSVDSEVTDSALTEIIFELENYVTTGIKDEELTFTKNSISNSDALKYETPLQKARFLSRIQRYNLDKNYTSKQKEILEGLTIKDINNIASKNIDKDNFVVVVVGNKYSLKDKLAKFGKVQEIKLK